MKIEFIYTYEGMPQQKAEYPFVLPILESQSTLIDFATAELTEAEEYSLVKISCCVYLGHRKNIVLPDWYNECNGKIYFTDPI